jgi:hypothetical protein
VNHDELKQHYLTLLQEASSEVSLIPSKGMAAAARRGLKLYEQGRGGDGLVPATITDARKMAAGEALSESKVRRMRAWFARHYVDKKPGWSTPGKETPGYVAHLLWGGDAGKSWASMKVDQLDRAKKKTRMQEGGESAPEELTEAVLRRDNVSKTRGAEYDPFGMRGTD